MNYLEWSHEYEETVQTLDELIQKLKKQRAASPLNRRELSDKISYYRQCRAECMEICNHLMERHRGVA